MVDVARLLHAGTKTAQSNVAETAGTNASGTEVAQANTSRAKSNRTQSARSSGSNEWVFKTVQVLERGTNSTAERTAIVFLIVSNIASQSVCQGSHSN